MNATFRCYQLRSVSGVLQAPSIEMEAEYTVLQVQPSDKVIDLFGDNPWAAGYQYLSVLWGRSDLLPSLNEKVKRSIFPICWRTTVLKCLFFCSFHSWMAARNLSTATEIGSLFNNCMNLLPIIAPDELIAAASKVALFDMPKPTRRGFRSPIPLMRWQ